MGGGSEPHKPVHKRTTDSQAGEDKPGGGAVLAPPGAPHSAERTVGQASLLGSRYRSTQVLLTSESRTAWSDSWLRRREQTSPVRNRMREICTSGTVRGGDGNVPTYSADGISLGAEMATTVQPPTCRPIEIEKRMLTMVAETLHLFDSAVFPRSAYGTHGQRRGRPPDNYRPGGPTTRRGHRARCHRVPIRRSATRILNSLRHA
jgi:hypothetical protein